MTLDVGLEGVKSRILNDWKQEAPECGKWASLNFLMIKIFARDYPLSSEASRCRQGECITPFSVGGKW
jgi:hypothetical protein